MRIKSQWLTAVDVMVLLEVKQTKAYAVIKELREQIANTKIPGTDRCYSLPPEGKIRKSYFCEAYMMNEAECDEILEEAYKQRNGRHNEVA